VHGKETKKLEKTKNKNWSTSEETVWAKVHRKQFGRKSKAIRIFA